MLYRRSRSISNFCYPSTDNVCSSDCGSNSNCDGEDNGMLFVAKVMHSQTC